MFSQAADNSLDDIVWCIAHDNLIIKVRTSKNNDSKPLTYNRLGVLYYAVGFSLGKTVAVFH